MKHIESVGRGVEKRSQPRAPHGLVVGSPFNSANRAYWTIAAATLSALALTACAHRPEPVTITKEVKVPVAVACVERVPEQPTYTADTVSLESPLYDLVRALLIDREQRKIEAGELRAAMTGCMK